ncbi:MAG: hypothetical protein NZT92_01865 [Abditibacteriales bacterium]|nr:hypothetical protein [Abditibacteriales bacterium]MDW8364630.1 hypothetical protein [Abditibacteriales bacterium]
MPTCAQCGSTNADTSTSCWKCYAPLTASASVGAAAPSASSATAAPRAAVAPRPVTASRSRAKGSPLPIILVLVLLLAAGGAGAYYWFVLRINMAKQIAVEYTKAELSFDIAKMKQLCTSGSAQDIAKLEQMVTQLPQLKTLITLNKAEAGEATLTAQEAQVKVNVQFSVMTISQNITPTVVLVREGIGWKVDFTKTSQANAALQMRILQDLLKRGQGLLLRGLPGFGGR